MSHAIVFKILREFVGQVARTVITEQARLVFDFDAIERGKAQGIIKRIRHVSGGHRRA